MRVELHPEARAEFRSVAIWYDEQRPGLGDEFVAEVTVTLTRIAQAVHSYPLWPDVKRAAVPVQRALVLSVFRSMGPGVFKSMGPREPLPLRDALGL